jgi:hypothetical protein
MQFVFEECITVLLESLGSQFVQSIFSNLNFFKLSIILQKGVIKIMTKELTVKFNSWRAMLRYAAAVT